MKILSVNFRENIPLEMKPFTTINATAGAKAPWNALSPFNLGPVYGINGMATNVENYWQFSKVFPYYYDKEKNAPSPDYFPWKEKGYNSKYAHRYPMGKESVPVGSWIEGVGMVDYVTARKMLYVPAYTLTLKSSPIYHELLKQVRSDWEKGRNLVIWDYDTFNHEKKGLTLKQVLNDPQYKYGHGFVLINIIEDYIKNNLES